MASGKTSGKTVAVVVVIIAAILVVAAATYFFTSPGQTTTTASSSSSTSKTSSQTSTTTASSFSGRSTTAIKTSVSPIIGVEILNGSGLQKGSPYYVPNTITLFIGVNNTVVWTNDDTAFGGVIHTVTATDKAFDSGNLNAGQTFKWTFTTPGTFTYYCVYHLWMKGTVIVKSG